MLRKTFDVIIIFTTADNPPVAGIHSGWDAVLELCPHSRLQWFLSPGYKCWLSLYCCSLHPLLPHGNHCWRLRLVGCQCSPDENLSPCLKIYCWGWSFLEASHHQQWRKEGSLQKVVTWACGTWTINEPYPPRPRCYAQLYTHCAGRVSVNTRPYQLCWGDHSIACIYLVAGI